MLSSSELSAQVREWRVESERLRIRRYQPSDFDFEYAMSRDPDVMRYVKDPLEPEALGREVEGFLGDWDAAEGSWVGCAVELRDDGTPVGMVCLRVVSYAWGCLEIGYRLPTVHRGHGYATEACTALLRQLFSGIGAHKVTALCVAENAASERVMQKVGMQRESLLREHSQLGGRWHDELGYAILARDWFGRDEVAGHVYHLANRAAWAEATESGVYHGSDDDRRDGFMHFSTAAQVAESCRRHRAGHTDVVLLAVPAASLGDALRWETSRGGALFPHLYGELAVRHVTRAEPLPIGEDGEHVFPALEA